MRPRVLPQDLDRIRAKVLERVLALVQDWAPSKIRGRVHLLARVLVRLPV